MTALYKSDAFSLAWDNDITFHVAQHAVNLRKLRGKSQAEIASRMGTSQSAVARLEAGDHNITMDKLKRLVQALEGRIRFAIEPKELSLPRWHEWWSLVEAGLGGNWGLPRAAMERRVGAGRVLVAGWSDRTPKPENTTITPEHVSLAEAK